MPISNSARYSLGACAAAAILAGCSNASSGLGSASAVIPSSRTVTTDSHANHRAKHGDVIACSTVRTLGGQTYTVA